MALQWKTRMFLRRSGSKLETVHHDGAPTIQLLMSLWGRHPLTHSGPVVITLRCWKCGAPEQLQDGHGTGPAVPGALLWWMWY